MKKPPTRYLIWEQDSMPDECALTGLTGFPDDWQLVYGEPVGALPAKARFAMNTEYPGATRLSDHLHNIDSLVVASQRLRELIEAEQDPHIEYLPVPIYNQQKRKVKAPYCVVHPTGPVDCLVVDACKPTWGRIIKTEISFVKRLVIDETRIPAERALLRPQAFSRVILVKRSLAEKIDQAGFTGMRWFEQHEYPVI
jgi:hypothetical protein